VLARFQISPKIINATFAPMRFDGRVKQCDDQLKPVPACAGGGLGGLMRTTNQHGAGL
jgi:hypothetical protein